MDCRSGNSGYRPLSGAKRLNMSDYLFDDGPKTGRMRAAFFVDQAARETLFATVTPRTADGGADGERWTG